jgi:hypothetical protein
MTIDPGWSVYGAEQPVRLQPIVAVCSKIWIG